MTPGSGAHIGELVAALDLAIDRAMASLSGVDAAHALGLRYVLGLLLSARDELEHATSPDPPAGGS